MSQMLFGGDWGMYRDEFCRCQKCGKDEITDCNCENEIDQIEIEGFCQNDLFTLKELEDDFELVEDMLEFGLDRADSERDDFLIKFKESDYESRKRLN